MKRKSILLTIVALLFAGLASAQTPPAAWPAQSDFATLKVVGSDTIFFCADADSIYPIEMGYDVAGKRLHPKYGDWSLHTVSQAGLTVSDYKIDAAGNVFKVSGSGIGGYIFQYESSDIQCQLNPGEKFFIYVFIMPDLKNVITEDTLVCYEANGAPYQVIPANSFNYTDVYNKAGMTLAWNNYGGKYPLNIPRDSVAQYVFVDTFAVNTPANGYTCGTQGIYQLKIIVDSITDLTPLSVGICASDTLTPGLSPKDIFKHYTRQMTWPGGTGTYNPTLVAGNGVWPSKPKGNYYVFTFSYTDCKNQSKTVEDTIYLIPDHSAYLWKADTSLVCRQPGALTADLNDLFTNDPNVTYPLSPYTKPAFNNPQDSRWFDKGTTPPTLPNYDYLTYTAGTKSNNSSLSGYSINLPDMMSSIGYHYMWRPEPSAFPCMSGDSGVLVVILNDPLQPVDYRVQVCQTSSSGQFDMGLFTGLKNATWTRTGGAPVQNIVNDKLYFDGGNMAIPTAPTGESYGLGIHKFIYTIATNCGSANGVKGAFYMKIANVVKIPSSITEKFCVSTLPATINLNEVIGLYDGNAQWSITGGITPGSAQANAVNTATGVIDIAAFGNTMGDYQFTLTPQTGSCFTTAITVTLKFVDSII